MDNSREMQAIVLGLVGAAVGGGLGYFAFFWFAEQGFYALILPPALLGLGAGICARQRSAVLATLCGVAGLALGLFTEWRFAPFVADSSLLYFITHLYSLKPITLIMLALGTLFCFRFALGRDRNSNIV